MWCDVRVAWVIDAMLWVNDQTISESSRSLQHSIPNPIHDRIDIRLRDQIVKPGVVTRCTREAGFLVTCCLWFQFWEKQQVHIAQAQ